MKRVLLLTTDLALGGAEMQVAGLARGLRAAGDEVSVVSLLPPTALAAGLEADGVPVRFVDLKARRREIVRLIAIFNQVRPQIVHAHLFHANLTARLLRLVCPIPVVVSTIHSIAESSRDSSDVSRRDLAYRATDFLSDATVCVSQAVADRHLAAKAMRSARVIPNGVDTARFQPDPEGRRRLRAELGLGDAFVWLAAGRLMWKKNYPLMLRAMARHRAGTLLIAGAGPDEQALRTLAQELRVDARFLGARDDVPALMAAADGFVLTSEVEGLPLALLEAAASELPAVATNVGGVGEVVLHGQTGFLVPAGDEGAVVAAMAQLPAVRERMGQATREHVLRNFEMQVVVQRWRALYQELLERSQWT